MTKMLPVVLLFLLQNILFAHDLFIKNTPFYLEKPGKITLGMQLAASFPGKEESWRTDKTVSILVNGPSGVRKLQDQSKANPIVETTEAGTYVIGWNSTPSYIKIDALHFKDLTEHADIIPLLAKAKANLDARDKDDNTALIYAALKGNAEVARALIRAGADVNLKSKTLETALLTAVSMNRPEVVKVLVESGANLYLRNKLGFTALELAKYSEYSEIVEILQEAEKR